MSADPTTRAPLIRPDEIRVAGGPQKWWSGFTRIGLNSTWLFLARLVTQAQLAFFSIWVARQLGAAGFGQYSFIASVVFLGNVLTTFGTDTLLIRDLARSRRGDDHSIPAVAGLQLGLSAGFILFVILWTYFFPIGSQTARAGLMVYAFSLLPLALFSVFTAVLRAWERMDLYLIISFVTAVIQASGALWVVRGASSLPALIWFLLLVQVTAAATAGIICWKAIPGFKLRLRLDWAWIARIIRAAWPLALLSILGVVYQRLGVLVVSFYSGDVQTGWFSAASRLVDGFKLLHIAVLGAMLPALSQRANQNNEANELFKTILWSLVGVSVIAAGIGSMLAKPLVTFLFGLGYVQTASLFRIMVWNLLPYTLTACLSLRLIIKGREKAALAATAVGLALSLGFNLWLVPTYGATGAASATVAGESLLAAVYLGLRWKEWTQTL